MTDIPVRSPGCVIDDFNVAFLVYFVWMRNSRTKIPKLACRNIIESSSAAAVAVGAERCCAFCRRIGCGTHPFCHKLTEKKNTHVLDHVRRNEDRQSWKSGAERMKGGYVHVGP